MWFNIWGEHDFYDNGQIHRFSFSFAVFQDDKLPYKQKANNKSTPSSLENTPFAYSYFIDDRR